MKSLIRIAALLLVLSGPAAAEPPVRVATLLPYVADAVARLDGPILVATTRQSLHEPPGPPLIDLGNPHSPSLERLAEARADVVVGEHALHGPMREALERSGAELVLLDSSSVDSTLDGLLALGKRLRAEDAMAREVQNTRADIAASSLAISVPALLLFGTPGSFLVVSHATWLGDLARQSGLSNVGADTPGHERHPGYMQVSDEVLVGLQPELVLLVAHGDPKALTAALERRLADGGPWEKLRTSARRGAHVLPPALFTANPGLRLGEAARHLHRLAVAPVENAS
jgi:iron complex transport system substrate-binding protein